MSEPPSTNRHLIEAVKRGSKLCGIKMLAPKEEPLALGGGLRLRNGSIAIAKTEKDRWVVQEDLAPPSSALAAMYRIAAEHQLNPVFPDAVESEVAELLKAPQIDDPALDDLTSLPFVTIDGPGTRDLDQALYIERHQDGFRVRYALADPAWCIRPGTQLFAESLRRGSSFYLPGLAIPMLPRALSEGILSLNEQQNRRAMVVDMQLDAKGHCQRTQLVRARIRSRQQLTFAEVQSFLDDADNHPLGTKPFRDSLLLLRNVGTLRLQESEQRDVIRYRRVETECRIDKQNAMHFVITGGLRTAVELYNEQLSLMCNVECARFLRRRDRPDDDLQPIYRVHPPPAKRRYLEFEKLLNAICKRHQLNANLWTWRVDGRQSLADFLQALPKDGAAGRIAKAIHRQAVVLNERSRFSDTPEGHHGVGADVYARFSAPMRELVGVFVHKEAWEALMPDMVNPQNDDEALQTTIIEKANESKQTQRRISKESNRLVLDTIFQKDFELPTQKRPTRTGTVMGMSRGKVHVWVDEPSIEIKVYIRDLSKRHGTPLSLTENEESLVKNDSKKPLFSIGDGVKLRLEERDHRHDRWVLSIDML